MLTMADPIEHAARLWPDRVGIVSGPVRRSFAEFAGRCRQLGGALEAAGIARGDRVAILADNSDVYLEVYAGVPATGRVVVPLNTRHAEPELRYALEDSGTRLLLTDRPPSALDGVVERVIRIPDAYETFVGGGREVAGLGEGIAESDLAGLFYTGGTTGASKGVMLSHRNLVSNAYHWMTCMPHAASDVMLVMAPLFHAAGSNGVLANLWTGGRQVALPRFDPGEALDWIAAEGCTATLGVPTMLAAIAEEQLARPRKTETLRWVAHGGSPIASEVVRRVHQAMPSAELVEVYGATELSPLATVLRYEETALDTDRIRSCGQPLPGVDVRILSPEGQPVTTGEVGEVTVRAPTVMLGYWNKPEQTDAVLRDGRYWTGDLGRLDADGFLTLVDRSKDMIVSGGENVYSTEVEEVLYRHPAVLEAAVFGVPDATWGEAVWAAVHLRADETTDAETLIAFCRESLGGYKVPKGIDFHAELLPKSGPGKFLKRQLRDPYWEGKERGIH
ncbi:MAG: AMP-binding protein [Myxococcota bacterium]